ncbi:DUF742 domain-containing protein [Streptomyces sp. NBC_01803]|uniref:DUF742 domain-containing protein n=1 Tax=Streptomyces sp. NBC_01803 TaxID=2975946 RepID=UPI002DDABA8E|nr:DUF742 domain-containing protein [Streptomyces sp. NBC_01803]WSA44027.1 DUF742 domain-containing protein [Streptomyces sp. NBC_01803]
MATPQGGPYGNEYPAQSNGGGRFNFPSAPSGGSKWRTYDGSTSAQPHAGQQGPEVRRASAAPPAPGAARPPGGAPTPGGGYPRQQRSADVPPRRPGEGEAPQPLVRPYAMTGGRTRPRYQLAIEALVSTTADPVQLHGQLPEHQRICQLCYEVKSVAEVSALLSMPLGVARILVADLAEAGLVAIHQPGHDAEPGGQPDVTLLERVLSGLRKL